MTRLVWGTPGERYYESGVDRGVLYVDDVGVAWSGLVSVSEAPSGGEPRPYYVDGIKYLNLSSAEEYEATIKAFGSPAEFAACDGLGYVQNGLFAAHQKRKEFGFSYRTLIGNDVDGLDHAYKIHLVYNALAAPTDRDYGSRSDSIDPLELSWTISTVAPVLGLYRPTAHLIIDSRSSDPAVLAEVEDILYGTELIDSRMPSQSELVTLFTP